MKNLYPLSPKIMRIECDNIKICQSKSVTVSVSVFIMKVYTNTDKICKQIKRYVCIFCKTLFDKFAFIIWETCPQTVLIN